MINIVFSIPDKSNNEIENIHKLLLDDSIDYFHLRKPSFDAKHFKNLIEKIDANLHFKIVIHSHYHLINEFDLAGINLNKKALNQLEFEDEVNKCFIQPLVVKNRQIEVDRTQPYIVSYSAHSVDEIINLPFDTSYVFLSPIFDSISKPSYNSSFNLENLKTELQPLKTKVIALGGVKSEHFTQLTSLGFSGCARLGSYWNIID
jgi:thiamine-phosphate pyrophosphorylase